MCFPGSTDEMQSDEKDKYIGDVIASNGSNDANRSRRVPLGYGAISQSMAVLHDQQNVHCPN